MQMTDLEIRVVLSSRARAIVQQADDPFNEYSKGMLKDSVTRMAELVDSLTDTPKKGEQK